MNKEKVGSQLVKYENPNVDNPLEKDSLTVLGQNKVSDFSGDTRED